MSNPKLSEEMNDFSKAEIEALIDMVKAGDVDAYAKIYDFYVEKVYKYFFYKVSKEEAFDLTENVFLKVWDNIKMYENKEGGTFTAWLFRIAHNMMVDHFRGDKPVLQLDPVFPDQRQDISPIKLAERSLSRKNLKEALLQLKNPYRELITLAFINDFSNTELAEFFGKNEGSIRVMKFRALRELKKVLDQMGVDNR